MAKALNHSRTSSVSNWPTLSRGNSTLNTSTGRPEISITTRDSVSAIGRTVLAWGGVVRDMKLPDRLQGQVDARMPGQQIEHMIEDANPGRDVGYARAVEVP